MNIDTGTAPPPFKGTGIKHAATRISMDEYGLKLAGVVKLRAACTRRQVGAVIIGPDKRVEATGYNGMSPGAVECVDGGCPRGAYTYEQIPPFLGNAGHEVPCRARHAEYNALQWVLANTHPDADISDWLSRSTIYITCEPCPDCASLLKEYGMRVVWP